MADPTFGADVSVSMSPWLAAKELAVEEAFPKETPESTAVGSAVGAIDGSSAEVAGTSSPP